MEPAVRTCESLRARPLALSVSRAPIEPTIVTSRPSRIHTVPRPMITRQWNRDQGRRSRRAGICVSTVPSWTLALIRPPVPRCHAPYAPCMRSCRLLGHAYRFSAEGATMRWECERGCGAGGAKRYPTPEAARRYAQGFDRRDTEDLGRRPLLSLLPLWLARRAGRRRGGGSADRGDRPAGQDVLDELLRALVGPAAAGHEVL